MMMNLFSIFDPVSSIFNFSLNWLSTLLGLFFLPKTYWMIYPRINILMKYFFMNIHSEMKMLSSKKNISGSTLMFLSLLTMIIYNNFLGLFPYIFTSTSHLSLTLTMAFPVWITFNLFGWINNFNHMFTHLVPENTPFMLMSFMVLIETISSMIRPLTLSVRLAANMIAGHLLVTLLSTAATYLSIHFVSWLIIIQTSLLLLEYAVALIQAYVFMVLTVLYSSEVN